MEKVTALSSFTGSTNESNTNEPPPKRSKYLQFMNETPIASAECISTVLSKVQNYFNSPRVPEKTDPLKFWEEHQYELPELVQLACSCFDSPASSAPVEHLFSIGGKIFRPDRCRLGDK